ncbi:MAG: pyridoxal-phosphate dependent enzyme [Sphingopyxis sp.]|nr:pyridoxal-phosphate dependent enzyme [Sphingopyxis sp.]
MEFIASPVGIAPTPLVMLPALADRLGVAAVLVKAENRRSLGNFKSLGAAHAVRLALERLDSECSSRATPRTLICASDGNHGLAVAAAAREAGIAARVYLPHHISDARASRISNMGAAVVRVRGTYDDAVSQARAATEQGEGLLIADTSDDPNDIVVQDVMAGYAVVAEEVVMQLERHALPVPTHLFVQAGVGGFAGAMAKGVAPVMAAPGTVVVVEPRAAACVAAGLAHRAPVQIGGSLETCADMLSCGAASAAALDILLDHHALAIQLGEAELLAACDAMGRAGGPATTPSGAAGLAGLIAACGLDAERKRLLIADRSVILLFATEAASPA